MTVIALFILVNMLLASTVMYLAFKEWRREPSPRVRPLWLVLAVVMGALVLGGLHRLALQAALIGWLSELAQDLLLTQWQLIQSVVVGGLIVFTYLVVRRSAASLREVELIAAAFTDRAGEAKLDLDRLTPRERDVLEALGNGKLTDRELAGHLTISESTVQSHIKALFRKTGLHRRRDLVALAVLVRLDGL